MYVSLVPCLFPSNSWVNSIWLKGPCECLANRQIDNRHLIVLLSDESMKMGIEEGCLLETVWEGYSRKQTLLFGQRIPKNVFSLLFTAKNSSCNIHTEFECGNGECIDYQLTCDGIAHCKDKSDEKMKYCGKYPPNMLYCTSSPVLR